MTGLLSKAGTYHNNDPLQNQDAAVIGKKGRFLVATLADGVSACSEARKGAQITCDAVNDLLLRRSVYFLELESKYTADFMLRHIRYELNKKAAETGIEIEEYSSTVSSVLLNRETKRMMFFSLGDSLILAVEAGRCNILAMPADSSFGCPVTTTENVSEAVCTKVIDASPFDSVLICSDGAWRCMYDRNWLKPDVKEMILNSDFGGLSRFLDGQNCDDDYSFISIDMKN